MKDYYGSNVHAGLEKSVCSMECPLWRGIVIRDSLGNRPRHDFLSVLESCPLQSMSALGRFHCTQLATLCFYHIKPYILWLCFASYLLQTAISIYPAHLMFWRLIIINEIHQIWRKKLDFAKFRGCICQTYSTVQCFLINEDEEFPANQL